MITRLASPRLACIALTSLSSLGICSLATAQLPFLTEVARGLENPSVVTTWPGNPDLLVVAERTTGLIRIGKIPFDGNPDLTAGTGTGTGTGTGSVAGAAEPQRFPLLDLSSRSVTGVSTLQAGLTGLAFHPRFNEGRQFRHLFVRYNMFGPSGFMQARTIISRFPVPTGIPTLDLATEVILYEEEFLASSDFAHVSGQLHFDPRPFAMSGGVERFYLYFPTPDMMFGNNVCGFDSSVDGGMLRSHRLFRNPPSQVRENAGKVLRLNVDMMGSVLVGPTVVDTLGKGLRNPYYFSFDAGNTFSGEGLGDLWLSDVGSNYNGEVMMLSAGILDFADCYTSGCQDFGWPFIHSDPALTPGGPTLNVTSTCWNETAVTNPFTDPGDLPPADYSSPRVPGGAILGGFVYRGTNLDPSSFEGRYIHGVAAGGNPILIAGMRGSLTDPDEDLEIQDVPLHTALGMDTNDIPQSFTNIGSDEYFLAGINQTHDGEVLLIRLRSSSGGPVNGTIFRIDQ